MNKNENEIYSTKDFYFSCLLYSKGFKFIGSEKKLEGVYFKFLVHNKELLNKLQYDFINYQATTNIRRFTLAMAKLRKELDKYSA